MKINTIEKATNVNCEKSSFSPGIIFLCNTSAVTYSATTNDRKIIEKSKIAKIYL
jgi:hypothetical protein